MTGHIFNIQDDGTLIEMNEKQFENEDIFQSLLEQYPNLLAGDQINSSDPRCRLDWNCPAHVPSLSDPRVSDRYGFL